MVQLGGPFLRNDGDCNTYVDCWPFIATANFSAGALMEMQLNCRSSVSPKSSLSELTSLAVS
jgi:hypothetical protein